MRGHRARVHRRRQGCVEGPVHAGGCPGGGCGDDGGGAGGHRHDLAERDALSDHGWPVRAERRADAGPGAASGNYAKLAQMHGPACVFWANLTPYFLVAEPERRGDLSVAVGVRHPTDLLRRARAGLGAGRALADARAAVHGALLAAVRRLH